MMSGANSSNDFRTLRLGARRGTPEAAVRAAGMLPTEHEPGLQHRVRRRVAGGLLPAVYPSHDNAA
jgi:hypothetical protein